MRMPQLTTTNTRSGLLQVGDTDSQIQTSGVVLVRGEKVVLLVSSIKYCLDCVCCTSSRSLHELRMGQLETMLYC
jgi:hypothetical protein